MSEANNGMRVFLDSNVLISAIISDKSVSSQLLNLIIEKHRLIICSYSITEVSKVLDRKFPNHVGKWDKFLASLEFELAYTPTDIKSYYVPSIRDPQDIPILVSAMVAQPDIFITGDRDFYTSEIREYFAIYTPAEFLQYFGNIH